MLVRDVTYAKAMALKINDGREAMSHSKYIATLFLAFFPLIASAAEIKQDRHWENLISIKGDISPGDDVAFTRLTSSLRSAFVHLESSGGSVLTAIAMGRLIHARGFITVVPDGNCASACALVWLGGKPRMIGDTGQIGFHAAYNGKTMQVSGTGNALIGAYLNELGLSDNAIIYITQKNPSDIQWLTLEDTGKYGLFWELDTSYRPTPEPGSARETMMNSCVQATKKEWAEKQLADDVVLSFCGCVSQRLSETMTNADWAQLMPRPKVVASYNFCRMRGCQGANWLGFCPGLPTFSPGR